MLRNFVAATYFSPLALCASVLVACAASGPTSGADSRRDNHADAAGGFTGSGDAFPILDASLPGASNEAGDVSCVEDLDVVFVMDVSSSMDGFLDALVRDIIAVDKAAQALTLPSPPRYGLVVFVDDVMFVNEGAPFADARALQQQLKKWINVSLANGQVTGGAESNSSYPENSLDALYLAATKFAWRPEAGTLRVVIHTTDDTFTEPQTDALVQHNYSETLTALQKAQIRVFSFAAKLGDGCRCRDVSAGWFAPYQGMPDLPSATGGRVWELGSVVLGQVSLADAIPRAIAENRCKPYPPPK